MDRQVKNLNKLNSSITQVLFRKRSRIRLSRYNYHQGKDNTSDYQACLDIHNCPKPIQANRAQSLTKLMISMLRFPSLHCFQPPPLPFKYSPRQLIFSINRVPHILQAVQLHSICPASTIWLTSTSSYSLRWTGILRHKWEAFRWDHPWYLIACFSNERETFYLEFERKVWMKLETFSNPHSLTRSCGLYWLYIHYIRVC